MKKLLLMIALIPMLAFTQNNNERRLLGLTEITVKLGHTTQFLEGVKKWKACYQENNGTDNWNFWRRVQGEGNVFILSGIMDNWAEMDKEDAAGKACQSTIMNFIMPHVEKVSYSLSQTMPDYSRGPNPDTGQVMVIYFKVNNGTDFNEIVKGVTSAVKAKEGSPRGWWYAAVGGSSENPDYFVSIPFKNFADLDIQREGVWKIYENAVGKKKADEMDKKWEATVDDSWSYIYTLNKELSNQ